MKIQSLAINVGRKVLIDQNEHKLEIGLEADLESDEDFESVYYSVRSTLEGHLENWEHEIRTNQRPTILTLPDGPAEIAPPLVTASEMRPKGTRQKKEQQKNYTKPEKEEEIIEEEQSEYICPSCGEKMMQKDGKEYYLCTSHWGYPDMIKKGIVKDRKF